MESQCKRAVHADDWSGANTRQPAAIDKQRQKIIERAEGGVFLLFAGNRARWKEQNRWRLPSCRHGRC
jgi:hypothetical protein